MILEGYVAIWRPSCFDDTGEYFLAWRGPNQILGEMRAVGTEPSAARFQTCDPCRFIEIRNDTFNDVANSDPLIYRNIANLLMKKMRYQGHRALAVFVGNKRSRVNAFQGTVVPGSLEALAQNCAANGIQSIDISTMLWEYDGIDGIDGSLSKYTVIVAHPLSSTSYAWSSEYQIIGTWYKFAVTETLSQRPHIACETCDTDPPASLLPLSAGQLLIPKIWWLSSDQRSRNQ